MAKVIVHRGKIEGFRSSWLSSLGTLIISGRPVTCENVPTVRALDACFGNVIAPDYSVNQKAIQGKDIVYSMDLTGLMFEAFTPTKQWQARWGQENTPPVGGSIEIETEDT